MKYFFLLFKILLSILLVIFFIKKIDFNCLSAAFCSSAGIKIMSLGLILMILQMTIAGSRLPYVLNLYGHSLNFFPAIRIWFIGGFFSHTILSFLGGDSLRIWCLTRFGIKTKDAVNAIFLDRVIGFCSLIIIFLVFFPFLIKLPLKTEMRYGAYLLLGISVSGVLCFLLLGNLTKINTKNKIASLLLDFASNSQILTKSLSYSSYALLLSIIAQIINILLFYFLFIYFDSFIELLSCFALIPAVMLITMLPISFAGWGLREAIMISGFTILGLPADKILLVSISFGIIVFLGGVPGLLFFLLEKKWTRVKQSVKMVET